MGILESFLKAPKEQYLNDRISQVKIQDKTAFTLKCSLILFIILTVYSIMLKNMARLPSEDSIGEYVAVSQDGELSFLNMDV